MPWSAQADPPAERVAPAALLPSPLALPGMVRTLLTPDGPSRFALVSFPDEDPVLYDLQSSQPAGKLPASINLAERVAALSEDGRFFVSRESSQSTGPLQVRSMQTGEPVHSLSSSLTQGQFSTVDFAGSDRLFAVWFDFQAGLVGHVWDLNSGRQVAQFPIAERTVCFGAGASPGGRYGVVLTQRAVLAFDLSSGKPVGRIAHRAFPPNVTYQCQGLFFSPAGDQLAMHVSQVNGADASVYVWDFATGRQIAHFSLPSREELAKQWNVAPYYRGRNLAWTLDGRGWLLYGQLYLDHEQGRVVKAYAKTAGLERVALTREEVIAVVQEGNTANFSLQRVGDTLPEAATLADAGKAAEAPPPESFAPTETAPPAASNPLTPVDPGELAPATPVAKTETLRPAPSSAPTTSVNGAAEDPLWPAPLPWRAAPDPDPAAAEMALSRRLAIELPNSYSLHVPHRPSRFLAVEPWSTHDYRLYDLSTGDKAGQIPGDLDLAMRHPAISPDGKYLAGEMKDPRGVVGVWSFATGMLVKQAALPREFRSSDWLAFCGPEKLVVVTTSDSRVQGLVWDLAADRETARFSTQHPLGTQDTLGGEYLALSPGGRYLAVLANLALHVFDLTTGEQVGRAPVPNPRAQSIHDRLEPVAVAFSPDGAEVAALYSILTYQRHYLTVWDFATGQTRLFRPYDDFNLVERNSTRGYDGRPLVWAPDKSCLLYKGHVLLDRATGAPVWQFPQTEAGERLLLGLDRMVLPIEADDEDRPWLRAIPLDEAKLVAAIRKARSSIGENTPPLKESDLAAAREIMPDAQPAPWSVLPDPGPAPAAVAKERIDLKQHFAPVSSVTLAPPSAGKVLVQRRFRHPSVGGIEAGPLPWLWRSELEIYDLAAGRLDKELELPFRDVLLDVSADGSLLLTGEPEYSVAGQYNRLDVWAPQLGRTHAVGWRPTGPMPQSLDEVIDGAFFIDKRHVLTHSAARVVLWRLPECQAVYNIPDFGFLRGLSPTRKYVFGYHRDRGIEVREALTGALAGRLEPPPKTLHPNLNAAEFRPDGQAIAAVMRWHGLMQVLVWDAATGRLTQEFETPEVHNKTSAPLQWLDQRYLLYDNEFLFDLEHQALAHRYQAEKPRYVYAEGEVGPYAWLAHTSLGTGDIPHTLYAVKLPTAEVKSHPPAKLDPKAWESQLTASPLAPAK